MNMRSLQPHLIVVATFLALVGCATSPGQFAGHYSMIRGGFNEELTLDLERDGTYVMLHALTSCVIGPEGEMPIAISEERGAWRTLSGALILEPRDRTKNFLHQPVFVPAAARALVAHWDGPDFYLVHADSPDRFALMRTKGANDGASVLASIRRGQ